MTLEQAIKQLGPFLYLGYVADEPEMPWCVMRPGAINAYGTSDESQCVAHGRTWQEAYAGAMGEAPF